MKNQNSYILHQTIILCLSFISFISCQNKKGEAIIKPDTPFYTDSIYYAQGFKIEEYEGYKTIIIKNPWDTGKTLHTYVLVPKNTDIPENLPKGTLIRTPIEKNVVFSAVICGILDELNVLPSVAGVAEPEYIDIPAIQNEVKNGTIINVGQASNPDVEKLMILEPEAIFVNPIKDASYGQTGKLGIPIIECTDYMETTPLGQTEWIKFYGALFDKKELADSLFQKTADSYNTLKQLTENITERPCVFTEMRYGDLWHIPGGKSYMAHLLNDAGAEYQWRNESTSGTIALSFEEVLDQAENCDFWLIKYYTPENMTYKELANNYANYSLFSAYKNRNIYGCNTMKVPYYRELPIHPDYLLKDLVWIFHPELMPIDYQPKYYHKMTD